MASIRGISINQYVECGTETGMYFMGFIHMDGEKIGIFENEGDGGSTLFDFDSEEAAVEFEKRVRLYFEDHPALLDNSEGFIIELLDLLEAEREFIKRSHEAKGPFILIQANTYNRNSSIEDITELSSSYHTLLKEEELEQFKERIGALEYCVFRNLTDFAR